MRSAQWEQQESFDYFDMPQEPLPFVTCPNILAVLRESFLLPAEIFLLHFSHGTQTHMSQVGQMAAECIPYEAYIGHSTAYSLLGSKLVQTYRMHQTSPSSMWNQIRLRMLHWFILQLRERRMPNRKHFPTGYYKYLRYTNPPSQYTEYIYLR